MAPSFSRVSSGALLLALAYNAQPVKADFWEDVDNCKLVLDDLPADLTTDFCNDFTYGYEPENDYVTVTGQPVTVTEYPDAQTCTDEGGYETSTKEGYPTSTPGFAEGYQPSKPTWQGAGSNTTVEGYPKPTSGSSEGHQPSKPDESTKVPGETTKAPDYPPPTDVPEGGYDVTVTSTTTTTYWTTSTIYPDYPAATPAPYRRHARDVSARTVKRLQDRASWCDDRPCRLVQYDDDTIVEACKKYLGWEPTTSTVNVPGYTVVVTSYPTDCQKKDNGYKPDPVPAYPTDTPEPYPTEEPDYPTETPDYPEYPTETDYAPYPADTPEPYPTEEPEYPTETDYAPYPAETPEPYPADTPEPYPTEEPDYPTETPDYPEYPTETDYAPYPTETPEYEPEPYPESYPTDAPAPYAPDDGSSYDDGSYDDGSYDDGSYDDGSYDDGSYDDGSAPSEDDGTDDYQQSDDNQAGQNDFDNNYSGPDGPLPWDDADQTQELADAIDAGGYDQATQELGLDDAAWNALPGDSADDSGSGGGSKRRDVDYDSYQGYSPDQKDDSNYPTEDSSAEDCPTETDTGYPTEESSYPTEDYPTYDDSEDSYPAGEPEDDTAWVLPDSDEYEGDEYESDPYPESDEAPDYSGYDSYGEDGVDDY